jgi:hypothetical protein
MPPILLVSGGTTRRLGVPKIMRIAMIPIAGLTLALTACGSIVGGSFAETKPFTPRSHAPTAVQMVMDGDSPSCAFDRVGIVSYNGNNPGYHWATDPEALEGLRGYVASLGVDGALDVRCGRVSTGKGICEGTAFTCKQGAQ